MTVRRLGPRPLGLHLAAATTAWMNSLAALPLSRSGWPGWRPEAPLAALGPELADAAAEPLQEAVAREIRRRLDLLLTGIERYRGHPYRRSPTDTPVVWNEDATRIHDYRPAGGLPLLVVPSLVNRGYVLDLTPGRSLLRFLADAGFRPMLVEWGDPGPRERQFTLSDYVAGRLERALARAVEMAGGPVPVIGYCMGGLFAVALAQRRPDRVRGLVLMATPWDFHAGQAARARALAAAFLPALPTIAAWGELPVDVIQAIFAGLDPLQVPQKFMRFAGMAEGSAGAEAFVALEDWLNDGVALAAPVAAECLVGWYGRNDPARGMWLLAGEPVRPERLSLPSLHLIPDRDRIVPPDSARALATAMPGADIMEPPLGHIGMVVSGRADRAVWRPLAEWLGRLP